MKFTFIIFTFGKNRLDQHIHVGIKIMSVAY